MNNFSLYVHIPFCESKCYYCDFNSGTFSQSVVEKYFRALKNEIKTYNYKGEISSIYFGGGTPSCVNSKYITDTLKLIKKNFKVKASAEITIEANPNSLSFQKLKDYFDAGFNRLSLGVQTTNKKSLKYVGRIVDEYKLKNYKKTIKKSLKNAKKIGFSNISADLMLGLPYNNLKKIKSDIKFLTKYCEHISIYMLTVYENTKLNLLNIDQSKLDEKLVLEYDFICNYLKKFGFAQYEVSNFAKNQKVSAHNYNYWTGGEYLGFGISAHSHVNPIRFYNTANIKKYINFYKNSVKINKKDENLLKNQAKIEKIKKCEKITKKKYAEEKIMLALRTKDGLDLIEFKRNFYDLTKAKREELIMLKNLDLITATDEKIVLTKKGLLVANQIILKLI